MKKITVEIKIKALVTMDESASFEEVMSELDFEFTDTTGKADFNDTSMTDYEILDVR